MAGRLASAREPHPIRIPTRDLHHAVVHKERKNNRVVRVTRHVVLSDPAEVEARLEESTYSSTVNTSGVERENGKLRADCARAARKTLEFAKEMKSMGVGIESVSRMLRHTSVTTTEKFYARMEAADAWSEAASRMAARKNRLIID